MIGCRTAAELSELSIAIEEAERSAELEQSLVGAEVEGRKLVDLATELVTGGGEASAVPCAVLTLVCPNSSRLSGLSQAP